MATRTTGKRRSRGEGSVFQRSDGRWAAKIYLGEAATGTTRAVRGLDGRMLNIPGTRTVTKTVYGRTKTDVLEKLRSEQNRVRSGLAPSRPRLTVAQVVGDWVSATHRAVELGQLRSTTAERYRYVARTVVESIGTKRAESLTTPDVEKMLLALTVRTNSSPDPKTTGKRPASDAYRRDARFVLLQALEDAVRAGSLPRNVARGARFRPVNPAHEGRTLTVDQARTLLAHVEGHALEVFVVAGLTLGLRGGETCALRWSDVDLRRRTVSVNGSLSRTANGLERVETKTEQSRAVLDMTDALHEALQRLRRASSVVSLDPNAYVLTMPSGLRIGGPVARDYASKWLGRIAVEAGILAKGDDPLRGHELRHSAASLLADIGLPLEEVSRLLRHTSLNITQKIYRHKVPGTKSAASIAADRIFGS